AWLGAAALGAVVVVGEPHAAATIVKTLARASNLRGPDRERFTVSPPLARSAISHLLGTRLGWTPSLPGRWRPPVAGRLRAQASRRSMRAVPAPWPGSRAGARD